MFYYQLFGATEKFEGQNHKAHQWSFGVDIIFAFFCLQNSPKMSDVWCGPPEVESQSNASPKKKITVSSNWCSHGKNIVACTDSSGETNLSNFQLAHGPWAGISEAMLTQLALAIRMELSRCYRLSCLSPQSFNPSKVHWEVWTCSSRQTNQRR